MKEKRYLESKDLTGLRFGRLVVLRRGEDAVSKSGKKHSRWECLCDCGNTKLVYTDNLISGRSTSCGCLRAKMLSDKQSTHKESKTHLYGIWSAMKARCNNPNVMYYERYGGRGIRVCDEWQHSYEAFRDWAISTGYEQGLTIDRINNDGNYEPSNCRWTTRTVQANNRKSNVFIEYEGQKRSVSEWSHMLGLNPSTALSKIRSGQSPYDVLFGSK